jgi:hypothetical protein
MFTILIAQTTFSLNFTYFVLLISNVSNAINEMYLAHRIACCIHAKMVVGSNSIQGEFSLLLEILNMLQIIVIIIIINNKIIYFLLGKNLSTILRKYNVKNSRHRHICNCYLVRQHFVLLLFVFLMCISYQISNAWLQWLISYRHQNES